MWKTVILGGAGIACLASLTIVLPHGLASGETAAGTISGASQATCTPAPCVSPNGLTSYTLTNVPNGDETTSTREYSVYRPANLSPSPANLAPAVLVFYQSGDCGLKRSGRFASLAPNERFIVVYMEVPCERAPHNWEKRNVNSPTTSTPSDEPYVTAVVHAITTCPSSGAGPNECVDPQRIYAAGASSGGNMTADVMCDVTNSPLFRGYLIDSSSMQLYGGAPDCPSNNRSFFVMMALSNYSIDGGLYYDTAPNPHLDVPLFADWAAGRLGCKGRRVDDAVGSPVASTLRYAYSGPCAYAVAGSQAIVTLGVRNGGHTWSCQDSDAGAPAPSNCPEIPDPPGFTPSGLPYTNGLFLEEDFWNFVAQSVSTIASTPVTVDNMSPLSVWPPAVGGSGEQSGGDLGGLGKLASVSHMSAHGDFALASLSCPGSVGSPCAVTLTLSAVERLRRGRLVAVVAGSGVRAAATTRVRPIRRRVIVGRETVTLARKQSRRVRIALNTTGRRLLRVRRVLAARLAIGESGTPLANRIVKFRSR